MCLPSVAPDATTVLRGVTSEEARSEQYAHDARTERPICWSSTARSRRVPASRRRASVTVSEDFHIPSIAISLSITRQSDTDLKMETAGDEVSDGDAGHGPNMLQRDRVSLLRGECSN